MKAAYSEGLSSLLDDGFRKDVEETLALISFADFPLVITQTLLYLKSAVETFGTVRKFPQQVKNQRPKKGFRQKMKQITRV